MTVKEAAGRLGVSVKLVYRLCDRRLITHRWVGASPNSRGRLVIDDDDFERYFESVTVPSDAGSLSSPGDGDDWRL